MGLVPLIGGHRVIATADTARLETSTRGSQTYHRRLTAGAVPLWELQAPIVGMTCVRSLARTREAHGGLFDLLAPLYLAKGCQLRPARGSRAEPTTCLLGAIW